MNQTELSKHLGVSVSSIVAKAKKHSFREGREFTYQNKGQPGKERKLYSAEGIQKLEQLFGAAPEKKHRPPDGLEANWQFHKAPPNPTLVYIRHRDTGETARMRVTPAFRDRFKPNTKIPDDRLQETTKPKSRAGSIWTGIPKPPEREFAHDSRYPRQFSGRYGQKLWDGAMV